MTSVRMAAILCLVLLIIGQGVAAPTDGSPNAEAVVDIDSAAESVKQEHLDYSDTGDSHVPSLSDADAEYEQLLPHLRDDYDYYSSSDDADGNSDDDRRRALPRSGHLLLSPSDNRRDGLESTISGYPEIQQQRGISRTLNPAYFSNQRQSYFPALQQGQAISQTLNPAYAQNHNNGDYRGRANAARLLYLLGHLSNARAGSSRGLVGYGQYSHGSLSQPVLSGTLGGALSYGSTEIQQPVNSNSYGSVGVINDGVSGSSLSGSTTYDYLSSSGSSYPGYSLGGTSIIKLIRPIARFVATQQTSPQKHWLTFLDNLNQAKISGSGAYQALYRQINQESQRQQRIILLLKRYKELAAQRRVCTQIEN